MRSKVTVNHNRMRAYNAIDVCTSRSYGAHQSIWHALITTLFLSQKREEFFVEFREIARADQSNRWQFSPAIFGNCNNCAALEWIGTSPTCNCCRGKRVEVVTACQCGSSYKQPASHEYIPFHTVHSCIHSPIHSFNRGHRHLTADQPPGLLGKHEFIGYY